MLTSGEFQNCAMHPSAARLFEAVLALRGVDGKHEPGRVAQLLGESAATVTNWKARGVSKTGALKAHSMFGINPTWLSTGDGEMIPSITTSKVRFAAGQDRVEGMAAMGAVPLISWIQAGAWSDVADPYALGDAEDWLPCPARHGARTYCLRVRGESMFNPGGSPSYANGDIIFVDPDREARPGDRVIVRLEEHHEATFKQLVVEDGRMLLKALNPDWKPRYIEINGHATITGVVIGRWIPE